MEGKKRKKKTLNKSRRGHCAARLSHFHGGKPTLRHELGSSPQLLAGGNALFLVSPCRGSVTSLPQECFVRRLDPWSGADQALSFSLPFQQDKRGSGFVEHTCRHVEPTVPLTQSTAEPVTGVRPRRGGGSLVAAASCRMCSGPAASEKHERTSF